MTPRKAFDPLIKYMMERFPPRETLKSDILSWAQGNINSWENIKSRDKEYILSDWREFRVPEPEKIEVKRTFWSRVRTWLRLRRKQ